MLPRIQLSPDRHFLVTEHGDPFFWLGDTGWNFFHRLTRDEAVHYLDVRSTQGFNVIQAMGISEQEWMSPNVNGDVALHGNDPTRPNEAYFAVLDDYIQLAAERGLYIALLPTWGNNVLPLWANNEVIFTAENAQVYGEWLGARYRHQTNLIWCLGGDRSAVHEGIDTRPVWRAMADGIRSGAGGPALITYHPKGSSRSSDWLQEESWLDINMMQSGHGSGQDVPVWEWVEADYGMQPVRPTLDGEPNYEDHPINPWPTWDPRNGYFRDYDIRKQCYRSVFAGACGVTYGHHAVWQFYSARYDNINYADRTWIDALHRPGADQMIHLRRLMESRPYLTRVPDQSLVVSTIGEDGRHVRATRDRNGRYGFIYCPTPHPVTLDLTHLAGTTITAWWYDPVAGEAEKISEFVKTSAPTFSPPGHRPDWVLVLDDTSQNFAPPGVIS